MFGGLVIIACVVLLAVSSLSGIRRDRRQLKHLRQTHSPLRVRPCRRKWNLVHILFCAASEVFALLLALGVMTIDAEYPLLYAAAFALFGAYMLTEMVLAAPLQDLYYDEKGFLGKNEYIPYKKIKGYAKAPLQNRYQLLVRDGDNVQLTYERLQGVEALLQENRPSFRLQKQQMNVRRNHI